ncbi:MAG TPA: DNA polymerase/3'-5' exonuclease PolX [Anaerolineales bacterium]|nr:DNA polymerase/3'-5' exonuclease PolX [Anaerolineales bacterium]
MNNQQIIEILNLIADLLQIKGEVIYKILAYRKAAEGIAGQAREVREYWRDGQLESIPGVGKAIAEKLDELFTNGKIQYLDKLTAEVPASLQSLLSVPDMGPKKVALVWKQLGVTNLAELQRAAEQGQLRTLAGMGEKSEAKILAGIAALSRRSGRIPLGQAIPVAEELLAYLKALPMVTQAELAGSARRQRETIGDLDLVAAVTDAKTVLYKFVSHPKVVAVVGQGDTKASVELEGGLRAQLWVHPPEHFGTALQYATGSQGHNVRLRERALSLGYSLSEHALTPLDGSAPIACATEAEVYAYLGLPWIAPELREDRGEVQAALAGKLPTLLTPAQLISDLHTHSTWSDGHSSIREMAMTAREQGLKILAIADHSHGLGIVNGMSPAAILERAHEIRAVQAEMGASILLLHSAEVEIRADGELDYADDVLAQLDIVVASLHVSLRQPREQITARLLNAIRNPHVDIIGHPTGRLLPDRDGADLDMEQILPAALQAGVALEINANWKRLDLNDVSARRYAEMGGLLSINSDAHHFNALARTHYGVAVARRAWVAPDQIINTWNAERLLNWLSQRGIHQSFG